MSDRTASTENLRTRVLRGGTFLVLRQTLGTLFGVGAVLLTVRAIGPGEYGLATAATGICTYAYELFSLGVGAYLVRADGDLSDEDCDQGFTCLVALGVAGLALALASIPLLASAIAIEGFELVAAATFATIPLVLVAQFPLSLLERALDFRRIAIIELTSQMLGHGVGLALAYGRAGAFALVAGFWVRALVALVMLARTLDRRPRLRLERARAWKIVRYGLTYGLANWVWQARYVVEPILLGRLAGADALGVISLANRFLQNLNVITAAAQRLGFATLARFQRDPEKLSRLCSEAMLLQVLAIGPLLCGFGVALHLALPLVLDARWAGLLLVYPYLALVRLADASFGLHVQVLHVLERSRHVAVYHGTRVLLFALGLVALVPRHGPLGYGYAEVASFASFFVVHAFVARLGVHLRYRGALALDLVFAASLFYRELGWPVALAPLAIALWPGTWTLVAGYVRSFRGETSLAEAVP